MVTMAIVVCPQCGGSFEKRLSLVKYETEKGNKMFCSAECRRVSKKRSVEVLCAGCGTPVTVVPSALSKSGRQFCSHSCSAKSSNQGRQHTEESKAKTAKTIGEHHARKGSLRESLVCVTCSGPFRKRSPQQTTCSRKCASALSGVELVSESRLESTVRGLVQSLGRVPTSKEVSWVVVNAAKKHFGSWNKMLISFGLPTNTEWMRRRRILCKDGHVADSISEMLVDNWLFDQGIKHELHTPYPEGRFTFDFFLPDYDTRVEYFGLAGEHSDYDAKILVKRALAVKHGLKVIEVFPQHLYPANVLSEVITLGK